MNKLPIINTLLALNRYNKGAVILLTVILLLIMMTLVTLYTGKIQSFEHQIMVNTQNQKWAQASAKYGLNQGIAIINVNKAWSGLTVSGSLDDNSAFIISAITEVLPGSRKLITIKANGKSADDLAHASVAEQLLVYPILFNLPPAPLMVKHGFSHVGEFEVVPNPDGLSISTPLSLWSDAFITLTGSRHHSCILSEFNKDNCSTNTYSDHSIKQNDIADESDSFPTDIFGYLFNIPATQWTQLQQQADFVLANCDTLDVDSYGVIWIVGDCNVSASRQIGSKSEPIILIIFDGNVEFQEDVVMHGLLFSFKPAASIKTLDINMQNNSAVFGVIISNYQLGTKMSLTRVVFQADVIKNLQASKILQRVARVPGSWHDF